MYLSIRSLASLNVFGLDNYANQHNPNKKAYKANVANQKVTQSKSKSAKKPDIGILDDESYGWCDD